MSAPVLRQAVAALLAASLAGPALPCTTFVSAGHDGPLFGRNYDFEFGEALVVVNPRGLRKSSDTGAGAGERAARWTARHGSVTFNQFGVGYPTGGINEAGLVVELLWLDGTHYPDGDHRPTVATLEFIQYLLDTSGTLDEALAAAAEVRIAGRVPLHFLLADAQGGAASVEFLAGRMVVHRGERMPVKVLANDSYQSSVAQLAQYRGFGGSQPLPAGSQSPARFVRAAAGLQDGPPDNPGQALALLDQVAQPGATHWQIVYEMRRGVVHYRTASHRPLRQLRLAAIDFHCNAGLRLMDIDTGEGDLSQRWVPYRRELNEAQLRTAYRKTSFLRHLPPEVAARDAEAPERMRCP
ncbi:linear amide C-N hydrolase [Eleftheria terrae]|uniref:linear amide C-N hydrolase n=1 Tax=Eleftheria terrae TaxID=1597781 RepID=UPI00263ADFF1|nr:linear amide C-N hydrolase [Eleftheria terrae]WKB55488.1 linear amide C-N hydrolase [Eleftheria terrae]